MGEGIVVVDVETQSWAWGVGGRQEAPRVAVGVTFHVATATYHTYREDDVAMLIDALVHADLVVGFAVRTFDYVVLKRYTSVPLDSLPTVDILEEVRTRLHRRVSLHNLSLATLGQGKFSDARQAVRWWQQGKIQRVVEYCRRDVELAWRLYEFGRRSGYIRYWDVRGRLQMLPVEWVSPSHILHRP